MENIIKKKQKIAENTFEIDLRCPGIAKNARPGQFVMVRLSDNGERIPFTIVNSTKTNITLVFKVVGFSTKALSNLRKGSHIHDIAGPLGCPSPLEGAGNLCFVAGGVGIAGIYPLLKALNQKGNNLITIIGAKSKDNLFWVDKIRKESNKVLIATEDGSAGRRGTAVDVLGMIMRRRLDMVYANGPLPMMKNVSKVTWRMVKTRVALSTLMVDGIGLCGSCRVKVKEKQKFVCLDGPEFDAHEIDWDEIIRRTTMFCDEEAHASKKCKCGG